VRSFEVVASVIAALFFIGVGVGVLLVIALPSLRRRRETRETGWEDRKESPGPDDDNPPRWPRRPG
jgi:hypothetical protein